MFIIKEIKENNKKIKRKRHDEREWESERDMGRAIKENIRNRKQNHWAARENTLDDTQRQEQDLVISGWTSYIEYTRWHELYVGLLVAVSKWPFLGKGFCWFLFLFFFLRVGLISFLLQETAPGSRFREVQFDPDSPQFPCNRPWNQWNRDQLIETPEIPSRASLRLDIRRQNRWNDHPITVQESFSKKSLESRESQPDGPPNSFFFLQITNRNPMIELNPSKKRTRFHQIR